MKRRLIEWNNDHTLSLPLVFQCSFLRSPNTKDDDASKSQPLRVLSMKNDLLGAMLIMIIFLAPIDDWLVYFVGPFFSLAGWIAEIDAEKKEGKHNLFLAGRKKRRQRWEKDFLHIILTFSRSRLFSPSLSLSLFFSLSPSLLLSSVFLFLGSARKNRLIVSFYKFPRLSSLVRRAKSRRRALAPTLSRLDHLPLVCPMSRYEWKKLNEDLGLSY